MKKVISIIHPTAVLSKSAQMGNGCVIEASTVVNSEAVVDNGSFVCAGAVVDQNAVVKEFCQIDFNAVVSMGAEIPRGLKVECCTVFKKVEMVKKSRVLKFLKLGDVLMNYLVVVAHPDDEVLGAGATIHKLIKEGHNVAVVIMVSQAAARKGLSDSLSEDEREALSIVGVEKIYHADFPNIKMNTIPHLEMVQFIETCIQDWEADAIITHHPADTNIDHVETSRATQAAVRFFQRRENFPSLKLLLYMEVLSSTEWALDTSSNRFVPNYFVEVGKEGIDVKLRALSAYKGVMRPYPHPRSNEALEGLAAYRGAQAGCNYAESFECAFARG